MGYQSEAQLEKYLVEQLQTRGYEAVLANFRTQCGMSTLNWTKIIRAVA